MKYLLKLYDARFNSLGYLKEYDPDASARRQPR